GIPPASSHLYKVLESLPVNSSASSMVSQSVSSLGNIRLLDFRRSAISSRCSATPSVPNTASTCRRRCPTTFLNPLRSPLFNPRHRVFDHQNPLSGMAGIDPRAIQYRAKYSTATASSSAMSSALSLQGDLGPNPLNVGSSSEYPALVATACARCCSMNHSVSFRCWSSSCASCMSPPAASQSA